MFKLAITCISNLSPKVGFYFGIAFCCWFLEQLLAECKDVGRVMGFFAQGDFKARFDVVEKKLIMMTLPATLVSAVSTIDYVPSYIIYSSHTIKG